MQEIIRNLKKAESIMKELPISNWGYIPHQSKGNEYGCKTYHFLGKEDFTKLRALKGLTLTEYIDLTYITVINYSQTDIGEYAWKYKPKNELNYYIEKLEKFEVKDGN